MQEAFQSLELVLASIENQMPEDFYSIDLMDAYEELVFAKRFLCLWIMKKGWCI